MDAGCDKMHGDAGEEELKNHSNVPGTPLFSRKFFRTYKESVVFVFRSIPPLFSTLFTKKKEELVYF